MQLVENCLAMSLIKFELQTSLVGRDCSYWNTATAIKKTRVRTSSVLLKPPLFGLLFTSKAQISSLFLLMGDGLFLQMSYLAVWEIWTRIAGNKAGRVDHSTTAANCCLFLLSFCRGGLKKKWNLVIFFLSLWSFSSCSVSIIPQLFSHSPISWSRRFAGSSSRWSPSPARSRSWTWRPWRWSPSCTDASDSTWPNSTKKSRTWWNAN